MIYPADGKMLIIRENGINVSRETHMGINNSRKFENPGLKTRGSREKNTLYMLK